MTFGPEGAPGNPRRQDIDDFLEGIVSSVTPEQQLGNDFVTMIFEQMGTWDTTICTPLVAEMFDRIRQIQGDKELSADEKFLQFYALRLEYEEQLKTPE